MNKDRFAIGRAVEILKAGGKVSRDQWYTNEDKYLEVVKGLFNVKASRAEAGAFEMEAIGHEIPGGVLVSVGGVPPGLFTDMDTASTVMPFIQLCKHGRAQVSAYVFTHEDILAEDWKEIK